MRDEVNIACDNAMRYVMYDVYIPEELRKYIYTDQKTGRAIKESIEDRRDRKLKELGI